MTLNLIDIVASLDENEELHLARILILLNSFMKDDKAAVEGITKLAKLDFLLRYPSYFEKAMIERGLSPERLAISKQERNTIEASMVRYRFGPWDHRYRRFLNTLAAKGMVTISISGRKISIDLTDEGIALATNISSQPEFHQLKHRTEILSKHLDIGATKLMHFIYEIFPELHEMEFNDEIDAKGLLDEN